MAFVVRALVEDQLERGWKVSVASPLERELPARVRALGAKHLVWRARRSPGPWTALETLRLGALVQRIRPDVVHLHSSKAGLAGRLSPAVSRAAVVFQPHGWSFYAVDGLVRRMTVLWERLASRRVDAIICVSDGELADGARAGIGGRCRVIRNGVDVTSFAAPPNQGRARAAVGMSDSPLIVCVGRLSRQKAQDVLLDAWPLVRARVPDAQLALVGDGPMRETLARSAGPGIYFAGERPNVGDWLAAATVVACPSRWEGSSLALIEAMAAGRSIVATDVGGVSESLGNPAAIVAAEDSAALATALVARLADADLRRREETANQQRAREQLGVEQMSARVAGLYVELLA